MKIWLMKLRIDDLPRIRRLLSLANYDEDGEELGGENLVHAVVSGAPVILPDSLGGLYINFRSNGEVYGGECIINCGTYVPNADIRSHLGRQHKDRWHLIGKMNKGHFLNEDKTSPLIVCETIKQNEMYNFRLCLGGGGARPLQIGPMEKFIREGITFQSLIQASLDAFLSDRMGRDRIVVPEYDLYASLTKVGYEKPDD